MILLGRHKVTYHHKADGTWQDGMWVEGEDTTDTIIASVQPIGSNDLISPELAGESINNTIKLYSDTPLQTSRQGTNQNADTVEHMGRLYKVISCAAYQSGIIPHYKMIAREVGAVETAGDTDDEGIFADQDNGADGS